MRPDLADLIPKEKALELLFARWTPSPDAETVPLADCVGRVLAQDQFALYDLPKVRASTMDGVAVHAALFAEGVPDTTGWRLGRDFIRADTGDDFDDAYDAVIAIEQVRLLPDGGIEILPNTRVFPGLNVKSCGADLRKGALLAKAGTRLTALDMAALAMGGLDAVPVLRRPRVGFLPTGSELVPPGSPLHRGQNFDTNSLLTAQLLREMGAEPLLHPIVRDDRGALRTAISTLLPQCDILLVNAGTSKGGEDYCAALLAEAGEVLFHGVAAVPGRPMSIAMVGGKPVMNLSGPTYAAFYSLDWAVRAMVCRYLGTPVPRRERVLATLTERFQMPPFFSLLASFHVERLADGSYIATPLALRGPKAVGTAASLTAEGVYVTSLGEKPHEAGETIEIELLRGAETL